MIPSVVKIADDIFGEVEFTLPEGYRHVPVKEFAKRRKRCMNRDNWNDLRNVRLFDRETKDLMDISSMPYRWRCFVEKVEIKPQETPPCRS